MLRQRSAGSSAETRIKRKALSITMDMLEVRSLLCSLLSRPLCLHQPLSFPFFSRLSCLCEQHTQVDDGLAPQILLAGNFLKGLLHILDQEDLDLQEKALSAMSTLMGSAEHLALWRDHRAGVWVWSDIGAVGRF